MDPYITIPSWSRPNSRNSRFSLLYYWNAYYIQNAQPPHYLPTILSQICPLIARGPHVLVRLFTWERMISSNTHHYRGLNVINLIISIIWLSLFLTLFFFPLFLDLKNWLKLLNKCKKPFKFKNKIHI